MDRVAQASRAARDLAASPRVETKPDGRVRSIRAAMGDPQAPLDRMLGILDRHALLGDDGLLKPEVMLVSMGDHFDWGKPEDRDRASLDGLALFAWLAHHPCDQVVMLAGNHDLGRVGELAAFDDETFLSAHREGLRAYSPRDPEAERALIRKYPALPTAELAARDFSSFSVAQRELVLEALRAGRLVAAHAHAADTLLLHAGVTIDQVSGDAFAIAATLNDALAAAVRSYDGTPLRIPGFHEPGSAATGEGTGVFYHRPTSEPGRLTPRRFDPRRIPRGLTQVIGHIGDEKCRELMAPWAKGEPADGELRTLVVEEDRVVYEAGIGKGASRIVFTDGGMNRTDPSRYALLDLDRMAPLAFPHQG